MIHYPIRIILAIAAVAMTSGSCSSPDALADTTSMAKQGSTLFLQNARLKVGIDLNKGGSITYLATRGTDHNLVNNFDLGRQVQPAFYAGPLPYGKPAPDWSGWGWDPIGSGDTYGNGSKVGAWTFRNGTLYVRSTPLQWALNNVPCECTIETWTSLFENMIRVRGRLINHRADQNQYISGNQQELPAVYTNGGLQHLLTYTGEKPFTGEPVTEIAATYPWKTWRSTESWAAFTDNSGWGLGVINPATISFGGGFSGQTKTGGTSDPQTGFIRPGLSEVIDHDIVYDYSYALVLGTVSQIRAAALAMRKRDLTPDYRFRRDRQRWTYVNARDAGWPIKGVLDVDTNSSDPQMIAPETVFPAKSVKAINVVAAFRGAKGQAQLFWSTSANPIFSEQNSIKMTISPDGIMRSHHFDVAHAPGWTGTITGLRFDPPAGGTGGRAEICAISSRRTGC